MWSAEGGAGGRGRTKGGCVVGSWCESGRGGVRVRGSVGGKVVSAGLKSWLCFGLEGPGGLVGVSLPGVVAADSEAAAGKPLSS